MIISRRRFFTTASGALAAAGALLSRALGPVYADVGLPTYGRSPGMDALPDVELFQRMTIRRVAFLSEWERISHALMADQARHRNTWFATPKLHRLRQKNAARRASEQHLMSL